MPPVAGPLHARDELELFARAVTARARRRLLGERGVGHEHQELVARTDVAVERHGRDAQLAREAAHGERGDALVVGDGDGRLDDPGLEHLRCEPLRLRRQRGILSCMLRIDHVGLTAHDPLATARVLAEILGAGAPAADGADGDMFRVDMHDGAFLLFSQAADVVREHVAFRVDAHQFAEVVRRLRERGLPFGNDPESPDNGRTDDPLGGEGRVYFVDANGHLFEVTC